MRVSKLSYLALSWTALTDALPQKPNEPSCRFARQYTQREIVKDPSNFISDLLYWEGKFHQNNVSYNSGNGMSYDGTNIDFTTGESTVKHPFSAASKESLQIMLYAHAVAGSPEAARFLSPQDPSAAPGLAVSIMERKLRTYLRFNETFPGFGGYLPWFTSTEQDLTPTADWNNRVPGLDNGTGQPVAEVDRLNQDYWSQGKGQVCAVTTIKNQSLPVDHPDQGYACEGSGRLNDPYEGELFTFWLQFFGGLSDEDVEQLWAVKKPMLQSVDYHMGHVGPITVQKGYWFSSHEQWKVMEMPYYDVDIIRRVFKNAERVRTCNSLVTKTPGMFASVNNITDPATGDVTGYISNTGVPSISFLPQQELDVITPYSVFPTVLFDKGVGLAWWRNMVMAKKMQNPYGSTESTRVDGKGVSALLTWDSKVTTVAALLGGVTDLVRQRMKAEGIYEEFISYAEKAYAAVFTHLKGEHVDFCLPGETVTDAGLEDFTLCDQ
ncbi:hypothetical protein KXX33_008665 [Aspergillus fumigatus]|nr:hypothetical protein KXX45_001328 [Aspergillus fumigatus]KAH1284411.1 hypothetical protein KXX30_001051 [Aspergillus fumigatus]KAH1346736.1 hypothetical protein KXX67_005086 [Aspergillus fumigatus]KAH1366197.1 hypothetical protein KXX33_008665 [Aspergillus fumigatus]KAH1378639.1 hypothetical protein KXX50_008442 [Aspergillus fumigatus]